MMMKRIAERVDAILKGRKTGMDYSLMNHFTSPRVQKVQSRKFVVEITSGGITPRVNSDTIQAAIVPIAGNADVQVWDWGDGGEVTEDARGPRPRNEGYY
jgi:hypothetical protein